jgi:hypothetical protein
MAYCDDCKKFYKPTADEEKLIATGKMRNVCLKCAIEESRANEPDSDAAAPLRPVEFDQKHDGSKLRRAEQYDADGVLVRFVALPRPALPVRKRTLTKYRPEQIHVTLLGPTTHAGGSHEPRTILHNNLEAFRGLKQPFWIRKIPSYQCAQTGTAAIEVPASNVGRIERINTGVTVETIVHLVDGGTVRMVYT